MHTALHTELSENTKTLLETISLFPQEQFNQVPFEGSWTAGQVAEHIYKGEAGAPQVWLGHTAITERNPGQLVETIRSIFLDFTTKMQSPAFILPGNDVKDKEALYASIKNNREKIEELTGSIDLELTFTDFAFPNLGNLTGIEWVNFLITHSKRHIHQLQNIYKALA